MYLSLYKYSTKVATKVLNKKENQQIGKFHQRMGQFDRLTDNWDSNPEGMG